MDQRSRRASPADGAARVGLETLLKGGAGDTILYLVPGCHGVLLHNGVRVLAGDARIDEGEQHLGGEDEAAGLIEVGHHAGRVQLQAVDNADEALEHVVECDEAIGLGDTLGRGVRNVTLVPQGDVIEGDLGVGLHDARQTADLLHGDGIALVRHGGAALLALTERLLGLERISLLQIADLGRDALAGGCGGGENAGKVGMVIAADDLRGQRIVDQAQCSQTYSSTNGSMELYVPTAPEIAPKATFLRASSRRSRSRLSSRAQEPNFMPKVIGSAWMP